MPTSHWTVTIWNNREWLYTIYTHTSELTLITCFFMYCLICCVVTLCMEAHDKLIGIKCLFSELLCYVQSITDIQDIWHIDILPSSMKLRVLLHKISNAHKTSLQQQWVVTALTFLQLSVPHFDDERWVFAVVDDPQGQSLDALLRAAQLRQLLLQGRLREGRHAGVGVLFPCEPDWPRPALKRLSSDLVWRNSHCHQNWSCVADLQTCNTKLPPPACSTNTVSKVILALYQTGLLAKST